MPKIALIECVKISKIALMSAIFFKVSNTDLYLSYFDLSYVFPGHNDSVQRGLTVQTQFEIIRNRSIDIKASGHQTASHVCRYIKLHPLSFTDGIIEQHHHTPPLMQIQLCSYKSKQAGKGFCVYVRCRELDIFKILGISWEFCRSDSMKHNYGGFTFNE